MSNVPTKIACLFSLSIFAGCAGQLMVFDQNQTEIKGVPFRTAEVYVKVGQYTKHSKGGACAPTPFTDTASLPTGARFFATAKTAQFAKTGFRIKFGENGAVSEIGLDSEPAAAESLKATNDLIKTLVPSLATTAAVVAAASKPNVPPIEKACDAGEVSVKFVKLDDYIRDQAK